MNHLEHTRRERGISYRQFAEEIGVVGHMTLYAWCRWGRRPTGLNARLLEEHFGMPVDDLIAESERPRQLQAAEA
ncbi:MAG: helix-turn-helix transcriptional regulator [Solirubrobacterales bacterium]|nr:helix-turn-helix transcriptional regulator [Solirubrobacterales bacterium]